MSLSLGRTTDGFRDEREKRDGRDGREHRVRHTPTYDDRGSKFRKPRTSDLEPSRLARPACLARQSCTVFSSCPRRAGHRSSAITKWFSRGLLALLSAALLEGRQASGTGCRSGTYQRPIRFDGTLPDNSGFHQAVCLGRGEPLIPAVALGEFKY